VCSRTTVKTKPCRTRDCCNSGDEGFVIYMWQRGRVDCLGRRLTFTFAAYTPQPPSDSKMLRFRHASLCAALLLAAALCQQAGAVRSGWCFTGHAGKTLLFTSARRKSLRLLCASCIPQRTCCADNACSNALSRR
jgi:hypothetical protein